MGSTSIEPLPLHLDVAGVARSRWPISQGLPFAQGELPSDATLCVVDSTGRPLPTQTTPLATWRADRKHVKWLLVDFQADASSDPDQIWTLKVGDPPPATSAVAVENNRDTVRLNTGPLELLLARRPNVFAGLEVDGVDRIGSVAPTLVMQDQAGVTYRSDLSPLQPMIVVEDAGPLRASVKISGYYADEQGRLFCPYELRLHVFAGRRDIRVHHTYIFDQDPKQVGLRSIELRWPLPNQATAGRFGGDDGQVHAGTLGCMRWIQSAHDHYEVRSGVQAESGVATVGRQTRGWAAADGDDARRPAMLAVIRDAWRQYPKGIQLTPDELKIELWPDAAEPLSYDNPYKLPPLRFPGRDALDEATFVRCLAEAPGAPLNLKSIGCASLDDVKQVMALVEKHASDRPHAFSDTDIGEAWGSAKTHEYWLNFPAEVMSDEACEAYAAAVEQPVLAWPDPAYVSATGAARVMHPADPQRFPEAEEGLALIFERLAIEPQALCPIYGMLNYGELINGHNTTGPLAYRAFLRDPERWPNVLDRLGLFNNESQDVINQLWTYYLRTGDRKYFAFADAKTRHTVDVDWTHTHPSHGHVSVNPNTPSRSVGLMHYHSAMNWSGPWLPSHSLISGIMRHYYLTGDRRSLDVALLTADNHLRNATPNGFVRGHGINREVTSQVQNLLEAWQATWDVRYEQIILRTLDMLHEIRNDTGNLPADINTGQGVYDSEVTARGLANRVSYPGGMLCYMLHDAYEAFGDGPLRTRLRAWIEQLADARVYGVRCDEYLPASQVDAEVVDGGGGEYRVADGWYWHSFADYSNYHFDVLVAHAWRLTGRADYLAYLHHRLKVFPIAARDAWRCLSGHTFNIINHLGDAVPAMMACVADADEQTLAQADAAWRERRAAEGWPVYDGPRLGFDDDGRGAGERVKIRLKPLPGASRTGPELPVYPKG